MHVHVSAFLCLHSCMHVCGCGCIHVWLLHHILCMTFLNRLLNSGVTGWSHTGLSSWTIGMFMNTTITLSIIYALKAFWMPFWSSSYSELQHHSVCLTQPSFSPYSSRVQLISWCNILIPLTLFWRHSCHKSHCPLSWVHLSHSCCSLFSIQRLFRNTIHCTRFKTLCFSIRLSQIFPIPSLALHHWPCHFKSLTFYPVQSSTTD